MAVYRTLKTLIRITKGSRTFLTTATYSISAPPLVHLANPFFPLPSQTSRILSPLSNWTIPLHGPLFLSFPPWKLSQSATPLYLQGNGVVLRKIEDFNLNILRKRTSFPLNLKFGSASSCAQAVCARVDTTEDHNEFFESLVNLPNLISFGRLISGPVLGWMITNEWYSYAIMGLAVSGATDWLDGYMARKMKINSVFGSYLDPLADKVLICCVALAMVQNDLLHSGLVGIVVFRDVALVGGAVYQRAKSLGWEWKSWYDFFNLDGANPQKVEPLFISKLNTVFQLILVAAALLQPEFGTPETQPYITYLSWLVASTTVASTAAYGAQYMRKGVAGKSKSYQIISLAKSLK